jgi:hypothetical protein
MSPEVALNSGALQRSKWSGIETAADNLRARPRYCRPRPEGDIMLRQSAAPA